MLEKNPSSKELLSRIFRAIHTVKGTSGVLGFPKLESVAHVGENLLSLLRDGEMNLDPELISGFLAMVDAIREMLREIEAAASEGEKDYSALVERISTLKNKRVEICCSAARSAEDWTNNGGFGRGSNRTAGASCCVAGRWRSAAAGRDPDRFGCGETAGGSGRAASAK